MPTAKRKPKTRNTVTRRREQARIRKQRQRDRDRSQPGKAPLATSTQLVSTAAQSSVTSAMNDFVFRKVDGNFYEILREGIPLFDAAIRQSITLEGFLRPIGDRMDLVTELEDFFLNVPVNDMQQGIQAFHECMSNEKFEQGMAIGEFVATKKRDDIDRLVVADSKQIFFRKNKTTNRAEPWFRSGEPERRNYTMPGSVVDQILNARYGGTVNYNGVTEIRLNPANKIYFSINNENQDPHGVSIMRSTEFVSQILVTIQNGFKHIAERFGDPSFHVHYAGKASETNLETRRKAIENDFNSIITAKRQGKSGDMVTAGGPDTKVTIDVIGHKGEIYSFDIPIRHLLEQIIAKTNLPAWLLGIYWSTTERMATLEVEAALASAKIRQLAMLPYYINLCANFLRLRGRTWNRVTTSVDKPGDWGLIFESPSYRDLMALANARFLNAQADMMERGQGGSSLATSIQVGQATFALDHAKSHGPGCSCGKHNGIKSLLRPIPWPELDRIENEYETRLKADWGKLKGKIFSILKLKSSEAAGTSAAKATFSFGDEERDQIMRSLRTFTGEYDISGPDSAVNWYYGQSYSLGLIQAANLVGKERPLLDILRNNESYTNLVTDGFGLVRDSATRRIRSDIISAMEDGMVQGINPREMASILEDLFDAQNSDWERLARTEMGGAAERAKLDEWNERGVDTSNAVPIPVHPRCRCAHSIVDDGNGNFRVKFVPAPDACPWCLSMQEGDKAR